MFILIRVAMPLLFLHSNKALTKIHNVGFPLQPDLFITPPLFEVHSTSQKRIGKNYKRQKTRMSIVRLYLQYIVGKVHSRKLNYMAA